MINKKSIITIVSTFIVICIMIVLYFLIIINLPYRNESKLYNHESKNLIFINPNCKHCQSIRKSINFFRISNNLLEINTENSNSNNLIKKFNITETPTLVHVNENQSYKKYTGTSTKEIKQLLDE